MLFQYNYKRFFSVCELFDGFQIFFKYGLRESTNQTDVSNENENQTDMSNKKDNLSKRDPHRIQTLFNSLNKLEEDTYYDFKFIKDLRTPRFALTLLEKVLSSDEKYDRMDHFQKQGLYMQSNDVIRTNLNQQSVIEISLSNNEHIMVNTYLKEIFHRD